MSKLQIKKMESRKREQPEWVKKIINEINKEEPEGSSRETNETEDTGL